MGMSWIESAVIYHIFIDRFAGYDPKRDWQQPEHMGGNLRGIIDKFEYIRSLGVNTIWLSPFYKSESFHGYDITDYLAVDERFGTEADLKELIDLAHGAGMKVIADIVPNHLSSKHPYFQDAQSNPDSKYHDWFIWDNWPKKYRRFITYDAMPKLNLRNPAARDYILTAARKWLSLGLDGYRIDHVMGLTNQTVSDVFGQLKQEFPDRAFIGEAAIFGSDGEPAASTINIRGVKTLQVPHKYIVWALRQFGLNDLYRNYIGRLDGMLDFYFAHHMARFARTSDPVKRARIAAKLRRHVDSYPSGFSLVLFLDNHDLTRYLFRCGGDTETLLAAAELQFSLKGPKAIYYGTEVGLSQDKSFVDTPICHDIQARKPMPWDESAQDLELLNHYRQIIARRSQK
jgi:cyclomaltodextrinase